MFTVTYSTLSLKDGDISYSQSPIDGGYPVDTMASFTCIDGYSLFGSESTTCLISGKWKKKNQKCKPQGRVNVKKCYSYIIYRR